MVTRLCCARGSRMVQHPDPEREAQSIERHVRNLLGYSTTAERRAYLDELAKSYEAGFVERVRAEFLKRWENRR